MQQELLAGARLTPCLELTRAALEKESTANMSEHSSDLEKSFVPKGAFAFFVAVLGIMALIWLSVYMLMIQRA